jgi:hypothetical protein
MFSTLTWGKMATTTALWEERHNSKSVDVIYLTESLPFCQDIWIMSRDPVPSRITVDQSLLQFYYVSITRFNLDQSVNNSWLQNTVSRQ